MTKLSFDGNSVHIFYRHVRFKDDQYETLGLCSQCRSRWNMNIKMLFTEIIESTEYTLQDIRSMCIDDKDQECMHVRYTKDTSKDLKSYLEPCV